MTAPAKPQYALGPLSLSHLDGVHPALVSIVKVAITITDQDFGVHEGLRSLETQRKYVAKGVSQTMNSRHLKQTDGWGHAVDLVPYVDGTLRWEWPLIYPIAAAVHKVAQASSVRLRWGGVWDRALNQLDASAMSMRAAVQDYTERHPGPDFIDGPHFELMP